MKRSDALGQPPFRYLPLRRCNRRRFCSAGRTSCTPVASFRLCDLGRTSEVTFRTGDQTWLDDLLSAMEIITSSDTPRRHGRVGRAREVAPIGVRLRQSDLGALTARAFSSNCTEARTPTAPIGARVQGENGRPRQPSAPHPRPQALAHRMQRRHIMYRDNSTQPFGQRQIRAERSDVGEMSKNSRSQGPYQRLSPETQPAVTILPFDS